MKRKVFGLYLRIKSITRSIKQVNKVHIMDDVIYDGKECFVNNGTSAPIWDLCETKKRSDGTRNTYRVHENHFKKVKSLYNLKNDLFHIHEWYMRNWYRIDLENMCR